MEETIRVTKRIARKTHECNACLYLFADRCFRNGGFPFSDFRKVAKAYRAGGKILPGEQYEEAVVKYEGEVTTIRQKPEINRICFENGYYDN